MRKCFNRTFMELKSAAFSSFAASWLVLIVPLWNWNRGTRSMKAIVTGFNRTFMELKFANRCVHTS